MIRSCRSEKGDKEASLGEKIEKKSPNLVGRCLKERRKVCNGGRHQLTVYSGWVMGGRCHGGAMEVSW